MAWQGGLKINKLGEIIYHEDDKTPRFFIYFFAHIINKTYSK
jgi:hypothetical protein